MKKIGVILCLLFVLLGYVNADTSKDIIIKYNYTDNTSKHTKEIVDNKVEYSLNNDKIRIVLDENVSEDLNIMFFEASNESLAWLKTKVEIDKHDNVYYFKILNNKENIVSGISLEEYSNENKIVRIYDNNGNEIENITNDCYIVIGQSSEIKTDNNEVVNVYKDLIDMTNSEKSNNTLHIIFIIILCTILVILLAIIKTRKENKNE